jgi:hypothetical protein
VVIKNKKLLKSIDDTKITLSNYLNKHKLFVHILNVFLMYLLIIELDITYLIVLCVFINKINIFKNNSLVSLYNIILDT